MMFAALQPQFIIADINAQPKEQVQRKDDSCHLKCSSVGNSCCAGEYQQHIGEKIGLYTSAFIIQPLPAPFLLSGPVQLF